MLQEAVHIKNTVVLIFWYIQCLHLVNSEVVWVLVSSGTQVEPQIILDSDYLPDYLSVSYDYDLTFLYITDGFFFMSLGALTLKQNITSCSLSISMFINQSYANTPFLYSPENIRKPEVFWCFRVTRNGALAVNGFSSC